MGLFRYDWIEHQCHRVTDIDYLLFYTLIIKGDEIMKISTAWMILDIALFVLAINLPLGRLRAGAKKYSWRNFGCIMAPVPLVVLIRLMAGISIKVAPIFLLTAIVGQRLGIRTVSGSGKENAS